MKSDEEFIAGIYKKARERKIEEKAVQNPQSTGRAPRVLAWRTLAVAACFCLMVAGAAYAGNLRKNTGDSSGQQEETPKADAVMALSLGEPEDAAGDAQSTEGDNISSRGRSGMEGKNGGTPGESGQPPEGRAASDGENVAADAMRAGFLLAPTAAYQNLSPSEKSSGNLPGTGGN